MFFRFSEDPTWKRVPGLLDEMMGGFDFKLKNGGHEAVGNRTRGEERSEEGRTVWRGREDVEYDEGGPPRVLTIDDVVFHGRRRELKITRVFEEN